MSEVISCDKNNKPLDKSDYDKIAEKLIIILLYKIYNDSEKMT